MGKKLGGVTWKSVALEGVPLDGATLDGFVGLEECTDYNLDGKLEGKLKIKNKSKGNEFKKPTTPLIVNPRKIKADPVSNGPAAKKMKLTNGFVVEECVKTKPSKTNELRDKAEKKKAKQKTKKKESKKDKHVNAETTESETNEQEIVKLEDMSAWAAFQVPEEILKALAEQGFDKPTKIQELCLPPAMLGRRDILGAAETGSGKTLAFGIPILAGIMELKEKEESGQDVFNMKFKKTSVKQKLPVRDEAKISKFKHNKKNFKAKSTEPSSVDSEQKEESSEHSVDNDDESNNDEETDENGILDDDEGIDTDKENQSENNVENGADEDSDDNNIHLSDMIDSEDLADSSDEEYDHIDDPNVSDEENDESDDEEQLENEEVNAEDVGDGVGCVKVIDNIDLPTPTVVNSGRPLYALIITPTRELAMQISKHLTAAAKYTGIRIATLVGGMAQVKQERLLSRSPEIVVCTPGRLWEMMQQGNPHLAKVDSIKFLAIDETDRMVERNHFTELRPLLERLNADDARRGGRQSFVMSATLTMTHDLPGHMKGKKVTKRGKIINQKVQKMTPQQKTKKLIAMLGMTDPKIVDLTTENHGTATTLTECKISCALDEKDVYLLYILKTHPGRTIVFCNSIGCVKRLSQLFTLLKCCPLPLHAGMPQRQRLKNLERFSGNPRGCLIATDVAARGLDIPNVEHVVHYQVPRTAENYVHRSGRTARANREGLSVLMIEPSESSTYVKLCRTLGKTSDLPALPAAPQSLHTLRACVRLARAAEAAALAVRRRAAEAGWLDRAARECDLLVDDDFVPMKKKLDSQDGDSMSKDLQQKKKQLDSVLSRPLFPKGFSYKYPTVNEPFTVKEERALDAVKKVVETGEMKKQKRMSKNASLLSLAKGKKKKFYKK